MIILQCCRLILSLLLAFYSLSLPANEGRSALHISAQQAREDFTQLYQQLQASHFDLFINLPKADYDRAYREQLALLTEPLSKAALIERFQRFTALGKIAHARIESNADAFNQYLQSGGKILPIDVHIKDGHIYINNHYSDESALPIGSEILAINGQLSSTLLKQLSRHLSADTEYLTHAILEFQLPRLLWIHFGSQDTFTLKVRNGQNKETPLQVPALNLDQMRELPGVSGLLSLSWTEREYRLLPNHIAYLRPGPFYSTEDNELWDTSHFTTFIDEAFSAFSNAGTKQLLIDLRNNPGGDNSFSDLLIARFADRPFRFFKHFKVKVSEAAITSNRARLVNDAGGETSRRYAAEYAQRELGDIFELSMPDARPYHGQHFTGQVYALINRHSYSNTVTVAATLQDYGFATILGEETADLASTLGAMEHFELKHSGLKVGFPKAFIIRPNGDTTRRGVVPDHTITTPVVESADDPVLQQAIAYLRDSSRTPVPKE